MIRAYILMLVLAIGQAKPCSKACIAADRPVCGSDGNTYPNSCALESKNCLQPSGSTPITKVRDGPCKKSCTVTCTDEDKPVCGSDLVMYRNPCQMDKVNCEYPQTRPVVAVVTAGRCRPQPIGNSCPSSCVQGVVDPVCGDDGTTYNSYCELSMASCDHNVRFAYGGPCKDVYYEYYGKK
ncbi:four-domain proteases inhibitor-like [Physella acuta]|uniref:four-domain proteases inhibitor-like n=1 Tax=Physella acuta TaxID=109671 RepID=UPI0027DBB283|nr:four-domain proteases inhibitor-like [Physella acuta]